MQTSGPNDLSYDEFSDDAFVAAAGTRFVLVCPTGDERRFLIYDLLDGTTWWASEGEWPADLFQRMVRAGAKVYPTRAAADADGRP